MSIIAKYKFDSSIYADLIPEFNAEFTSDLYTVTDEVDSENSNHIIRTIESDSLPTLMRFGSNLETYTEGNELALLEVLAMNTSRLTSCSRMFRYNRNLTGITCEWDTSNVTDMYAMFSNCDNLTSLDVSNFNTSKVTNMFGMFYGCNNLTSLNVINFNTSNVTNMSDMFAYCVNLTSLDVSNFNTSKVTDMGWMFDTCYNLTSLDVSNFNTSKVTNMATMFSQCCRLTEIIGLENWNTSKVTNMHQMFNNCAKLTSLDVSNWDTSKVTIMKSMFEGCSELINLNVSNWNVSSVNRMDYMFWGCGKLTSIDVSNWNTSKVLYFEAMFAECHSLTSLNVSNWDTSSVQQVSGMMYMFYNCQSLTSLDLSNFDTSKVTNMTTMFANCYNLITLDVSNFDTSKVTDASDMFNNTRLLKDIGMLYCDQSTINKIASLLPTDTTQTIWVEDVDIKDLTPVEGVEFKQYAKNTEVMLTSPLLEGDKLVVKDGKTYHYHKMGMVVLDGSEDYEWQVFGGGENGDINRGTTIGFYKKVSTGSTRLPNQKRNLSPSQLFSDRFKVGNHNQSYADKRCITTDNTFNLCFDWNELPERTSDGVNQWLQQNPTTVVYELEEPYYELISEDSLDISLIAESSDITNSSNIPLNMTINNKGLSTVAMSPSTTYTVAFDKDTDSEVVVNLCGNEVTTTDNVVEITTPSEIDDELIFYGDGVEVSNVRLLEGNVSEDSVPRESFKGLKNSFEDGYIPSPIFTNIEGGIVNSATQIVQSATEIRNGKIYTLHMEVTENTLNSLLVWELTSTYGQSRLNVLPGETGMFTVVVEVPGSTVSNTIWQSAGVGNGTSVATKEGSATVKNLIILEGDWTHLTEEDWNNLGKYKVEYKVTGKNKATFQEEGCYYEFKTGNKLFSNTHDSYIALVEPDKTYIVSFENTDRIEISNLCFWDSSMKFIEGLAFANGDVTFTAPYNAKFITIAVNKLATTFQIEEGSTATEYEPYKEDIKTYYLSSPLLKGDTIEDISGVATHIKRKKEIKLNLDTYTDILKLDEYNVKLVRLLISSELKGENVYSEEEKPDTKEALIVEKANVVIRNWSNKFNKNDIYLTTDGHLWLAIDNTLTSVSKEYIEENVGRIVARLASPIYEPISTESILCDSYANGHLDVDTNIPIEKVEFKYWCHIPKYIQPSTKYKIQFEADNTGWIDKIALASTNYKLNIPVTKGVNVVEITTDELAGSSLGRTYLDIMGIGFNASNIQVVATDRDVDFGYFKGLQSSFENNMENLWDGTFVKGTYISTNSTYIKDISEARSVCIKCRPNTTYIITATNNDRLRIGHVSELVNEIDEIPCMISDIDDTNISYKEFTTTHREGYLIMYVATDDNTNENITVDIREKVNKVECKVVGKNKFDSNALIKQTSVIIEDGTIDLNYDRCTTDFIKVKPNTTYTKHNLDGFQNVWTTFYDVNKNYLGEDLTRAIAQSNTFVTPSNAYYIRNSIHKQSMTNEEFLYIQENWQLEEGTQATSYEPYQEYTKTIYLNSPLLKGDKIEVHDGKLCHYHKMGKVVLDGSEDEGWIYDNGWKDFRWNNLSINHVSTTGDANNALCDKLVFVNYATYLDTVNGSCILFNSSVCTIKNYNINQDIETFRKWLQADPLTAVYKLAEPYYEEITPLQEDLIITSVKEGDLHIDTIVPVSSKVTYNVNVQLLTDFEQSIVEQVQATQTTDLQSILDEEIDN